MEREKKLYDSGPIDDELPQFIEFFPGLIEVIFSFDVGKCRHSIPLRFFDKIRGYKIAIALYTPLPEMSGIWILYKLKDMYGLG